MVDYVKMAKDLAKDRKKKESDAAKKAKEERDEKDRLVAELMKMLKEALADWDGVSEFTVKDLGDKSWVDCIQIDRRGERCVGFQVHWTSWESQWSDEVKSTDSGQIILMTLYQERGHGYWQDKNALIQEPFRYGSNAHIVEECMKRLSQYLSKFL